LTVFSDETFNEVVLLGCSALRSSEIADLYLRYVIVVPKPDPLALCIFPVDEHIPFCVIAEFPSEEATGSSYPLSPQIHIPLHTPSLHGSCFMCVLMGLLMFWKRIAYSVACLWYLSVRMLEF